MSFGHVHNVKFLVDTVSQDVSIQFCHFSWCMFLAFIVATILQTVLYSMSTQSVQFADMIYEAVPFVTLNNFSVFVTDAPETLKLDF